MDAASADASALAEDASERLLDLQLAFNLYPAWYAHLSWLALLGDADELSQESYELRGSPLWIRSTSSALLRGSNLHRHFESDFFDPAKRLALIDADSLRRIAGHVSATLLRTRLRRVVEQREVQAVHACMGAEAHAFAVRWDGLLPMVAPIVDPNIHSDQWPTAATWEHHSVAQLLSALPNHAIGVLGRLRMKFPSDWSLPRQRLVEPQRVSFTRLIVSVILESNSPWRWLFAPDFNASLASEAANGASPC